MSNKTKGQKIKVPKKMFKNIKEVFKVIPGTSVVDDTGTHYIAYSSKNHYKR